MQLFIVDAFTAEPFHGNPAGVVLLSMQEPPPPVRFMQQLAAELRHSETVFVQPTGPRDFTLRYFTPAEEAALCGHAPSPPLPFCARLAALLPVSIMPIRPLEHSSSASRRIDAGWRWHRPSCCTPFSPVNGKRFTKLLRFLYRLNRTTCSPKPST